MLIGKKSNNVSSTGLVYAPYIASTTICIEAWVKKAEEKVKAVNRQRKIDYYLNDIEYQEYTLEETEEYKEYEKTCDPKGNLMYLDYIYDPTPTIKK